jgi:hypothetical protein
MAVRRVPSTRALVLVKVEEVATAVLEDSVGPAASFAIGRRAHEHLFGRHALGVVNVTLALGVCSV